MMTPIRWSMSCLILALMIVVPKTFAENTFEYAQPPAENAYTPLTPVELEELVAPIALYPDPLLGIVLPASTFPLQVVQAARYLRANEGAVDPPEGSEWDSSVIALLRYPEVLFMMDERIDWTGKLADAMYYQQSELMDAVQRVRVRAQEAGRLKSDDKQVVVKEKEIIRIEPANPEVVYVPIYDPQVIYVPGPPVISYTVGYPCGPWLPYTWDWYVGGFFFTNFYFGGHWHTYWGGGDFCWYPHHYHNHHHYHHDHDDYDPEDVAAGKVPRTEENTSNGKVPREDVASRKVPKTDPSGYPIEKPGDRSYSPKTPRFEKEPGVVQGKTPYRVQGDQKPNRTTLKIPSQNNGSSYRGYTNSSSPGFSTRSYTPKTPRNYKSPNITTQRRSYKVPTWNFSAPSPSFSVPSTRSMKVPRFGGSSHGGFSGGKGFGGGGGKVPKGGK